VEVGEQRLHVDGARQGEASVGDPEGPGLRGLLEQCADRTLFEPGLRPENGGAARRRAGQLRDELEDDVELERLAFDAVLPGTGG